VYNEEKRKNLMNIQKKIIEKGIQKQSYIVFENCLTKEFNTQLFTDLITQHRHYNITIIMSTQYIYKINPTIRECSNYAIIFRQSTNRSLTALYESFGNHFNKFDDFKKFLIDNTSDHNFIFVDVNSSSENVDEIYLICKAPDKIPSFFIKFKNKLR